MAVGGGLDSPWLPHVGAPVGIRLGYVTVVNPGVNVQYVRSSGQSSADPPELTGRIYTTLNAALAQCRSGAGDVVIALPGHAENIASANAITSSLVAGTKIIGLGSGADRPTFTWTAALSSLLLNKANVVIDNCVLQLATAPGTTTAATVAAPITVSAAGCSITNCYINFGIDADQIVTNGITTTAAGTDFVFSNNYCVSATTAECTSFLKLVGADRCVLRNNYIAGATSSAAVGLLLFATTASVDIYSANNVIINRKASSAAAVTGLAAVSGFSRDDTYCYLDDTTKTGWAVSTGNMFFRGPQISNLASEQSIAAATLPTASA